MVGARANTITTTIATASTITHVPPPRSIIAGRTKTPPPVSDGPRPLQHHTVTPSHQPQKHKQPTSTTRVEEMRILRKMKRRKLEIISQNKTNYYEKNSRRRHQDSEKKNTKRDEKRRKDQRKTCTKKTDTKEEPSSRWGGHTARGYQKGIHLFTEWSTTTPIHRTILQRPEVYPASDLEAEAVQLSTSENLPPSL